MFDFELPVGRIILAVTVELSENHLVSATPYFEAICAPYDLILSSHKTYNRLEGFEAPEAENYIYHCFEYSTRNRNSAHSALLKAVAMYVMNQVGCFVVSYENYPYKRVYY